MQEIQDFFAFILNSQELVSKGGLLLVCLIVFAETGIFFCFFLPGDYLLFTAGMFCGLKYLLFPVWYVILCICSAAVAGNFVGFYFGKYLGNVLMNRKDSFFFRKQYIVNTEAAFQRYGGNALILGRFLPVIRTFAPILAGMTRMNFSKFVLFNVSGAALWSVSLCFTGYYLGITFPEIIHYIEYIILVFILITSFAVGKSLLTLGKKSD